MRNWSRRVRRLVLFVVVVVAHELVIVIEFHSISAARVQTKKHCLGWGVQRILAVKPVVLVLLIVVVIVQVEPVLDL